MYLNIKIKEDFRTLKKDSEYKFDFAERNRYLMVGPNGTGIQKEVDGELG